MEPEFFSRKNPSQSCLKGQGKRALQKLHQKGCGFQWETLVAQASGARECVASPRAAFAKFPNSAHRLISGEIPADCNSFQKTLGQLCKLLGNYGDHRPFSTFASWESSGNYGWATLVKLGDAWMGNSEKTWATMEISGVFRHSVHGKVWATMAGQRW